WHQTWHPGTWHRTLAPWHLAPYLGTLAPRHLIIPPMFNRTVVALVVALSAASSVIVAQRGQTMTPEQAQRRLDLENELQSIAIVERKVMMPMRDGVRLATDIYRPKNASGK